MTEYKFELLWWEKNNTSITVYATDLPAAKTKAINLTKESGHTFTLRKATEYRLGDTCPCERCGCRKLAKHPHPDSETNDV